LVNGNPRVAGSNLAWILLLQCVLVILAVAGLTALILVTLKARWYVKTSKIMKTL